MAPPRTLLIGWDAADWPLLNPLLDAGLMPALNHLVDTGVIGELQACQPLDAGPLWATVATGKRPWRHGFHASHAFHAPTQQAMPTGAAELSATPLWQILANQAYRSFVVGWPATHASTTLAEELHLISDRYPEPTAPPGVKPWPTAPPGTYYPGTLAATFDPLRVAPSDIGADVISRHIPEWRQIDQKNDRRLGQLRFWLAANLSIFSAGLHILRAGTWDFGAIRLPLLGQAARTFLPFHPPVASWIDPTAAGLYSAVIRTLCQTLDQMLHHLVQAAGPGTNIWLVSPHGTRPPQTPPGGYPANELAWKSPTGLFVATGPDFNSDVLLHGAGCLDIAPTLLATMGLPVGQDLDGRILVEAWRSSRPITRIPSWDPVGPMTAPAPSVPLDHPLAERLRQLRLWQSAQSALEAGEARAALPWLENLFRSNPENVDFCHALFACQIALEQFTAAESTLTIFQELVPPGLISLIAQAELALARGQLSTARQLAREALPLTPAPPALLRRLGVILLRLREWTTVADLAREGLKQDESDPLVWLGLAEASLRLQAVAAAEQAARRAIQLKYYLPDAHFILTRSLVAQNKWAEACTAMAALRQLQPENRTAAAYQERLERTAAGIKI